MSTAQDGGCEFGTPEGLSGARSTRHVPSVHFARDFADPLLQTHSVMSPLVLILVVILVLSVMGGGFGVRRGNNTLAGGSGLVGLVLVVLLIMFLTGNL